MFERIHRVPPAPHPFDRPLLAVAYFALVCIFMALDLVADLAEGEGGLHLLVEGTIMLLSLAGLGLLLRDGRRRARQVGRLRSDLDGARGEADRLRREAQALMRDLGQAIDRQFQAWALSPAETEVGLLLLKGLSHKEIANSRGTSERTVRQQAREVYRKSRLSGRAELAAWFLEDLLQPTGLASPDTAGS
jgi:DNA-binding CsgD family transcriptional regulator